jgi:hypothetical protein
MVHLTILSLSETVQAELSVNAEMEGIWKEVVVAKFEILSRHLHGTTEGKLRRTSG